jgi:serine acetyltransferase
MNLNKIYISFFRYRIQHYNPEKYWRRRQIVVDPNAKIPKWLKWYYLYYVKKCDAYNNASFGTYMNEGAKFAEPPYLMHGLNGIIIGKATVVGRKCVIGQQVTIQDDIGGGVKIHDNCMIGAGAKILSPSNIGNNVRIGANAVVKGNIPDNATVVPQKSRIIIREEI